ncbi:bifunctional aminoglycoside phosphotransferase/ATP-binding protein [Candidatus Nitrotoga sp. M5]|uniref:bifunctional aminoglycoside phosphotransferase/ATP-binding protein n=1 Tax=Candidatus Nitrotoga sp. M5 TaxID=2890409 RepID=UPI001EF24300|nr:bifunctional aminoglycoside phosphotransferase/ATP-binding protein [Candidatus Nitrotoga sp. M5]CAH1385409.1 Aminoglycoside phosphotransferase [Candidatus Nitrotoga sp. M5]
MSKSEKLPALISALLSPTCYDHAVGKVQLIETHISWVLLTGEYAYKLKKPLNLGFLNFSTLEQRQQACADEVRLNRRLATEIYIGVVTITGNADAPRIGGQGDIIEYAVKMRQFPIDSTLDSIDLRGELTTEQIDQLAARLAHFHLTECSHTTESSSWGEPDAIAQSVLENFHPLTSLLESSTEKNRLAELQRWSVTEHNRLKTMMCERKRDGWVRECHGDLHLGNLAWMDGKLLIFDCIEFNSSLRWIDVISEVAFCFMDLLHRQHRDLAMRFLNAWLEISGDYDGIALLRYYAVYRALVRAKVAALRAKQSDDGDVDTSNSDVNTFLQLAENLSQNIPVQLWITHGLSGSGKTTLTQSLLQNKEMIRLRSDIERKRLAGLGALSRSHSEIGEALYSKEASHRTYSHLARLTEILLCAGYSVIIDAAFLEYWQRDLFRNIAQRLGVSFQILDIEVDFDTLRERISRRAAQGKDASEANLRVLEHQIESAQEFNADELDVVTRIYGTSEPPDLNKGRL